MSGFAPEQGLKREEVEDGEAVSRKPKMGEVRMRAKIDRLQVVIVQVEGLQRGVLTQVELV